MTSRDHLLGHAPAAQFDGEEFGADYPLGIPKRCEHEWQIAVPLGAPGLSALLPNGMNDCTKGDERGINRRTDVQSARLRAAISDAGQGIEAMRNRQRSYMGGIALVGGAVEADEPAWSDS